MWSFFALAEVKVIDRVLHYTGPINHAQNEDVFRMTKNITIDTINIKSRGGGIQFGISLGQWISKNNIDVAIDSYCLSSCANYVFPAGKRTFLKGDAVVAWHGGAFQLKEVSSTDYRYFEDVNNLDESCELDLLLFNHRKKMVIQNRELLEKECLFLKSMGIGPYFLISGQLQFEYQKNKSLIWSYTHTALRLSGMFKNLIVLGKQIKRKTIFGKTITYYDEIKFPKKI